MKLHRVAYSNLGHNRPWNGVREVDYDTHPTGIIRPQWGGQEHAAVVEWPRPALPT